MGWNPANWQIIDMLQGQEGSGGLLGNKVQSFGANTPKSASNILSNSGSGSSSGQVLGDSTGLTSTYYDAELGRIMQLNPDGSRSEAQNAPTANPNPTRSTFTTGQTAAQTQAAQQKAQQNAEYQRQINAINGILGVYSAQKGSGISGIDNQYNEQKARLGEQRASAMTGYDDQNNLALQGRTRGYEQVDKYANDSANSLSRIFQGANAGNSSVARILAPSLVGKAADSRRLDVTTTANQNLSGIKKARDEANTEFDYSTQDLENNRGYAKDAFEKNLTQQEIDQYNSRLAVEQGMGADTSGTQNEINSRTARLSQLFGAGSFNPQYQVRAVAPKAVQLADYQVDPVKLQAGQQQSGGGFYAQQLKKKNELRVR